MSKRILLTLHEPPSANKYWRHVGSKVVLSRMARLYKKAVALSALCQGIREALPLSQECSVTLVWFRKRKSGDLDNRIKILLDALQGVVYQSDAQVVELHAFRRDDKENPRCEVIVTPL